MRCEVVTRAIAAEKGHSQITAWTLLQYWLHESAWGAASRAAHGGLQRQRTDDRAKQPDHIARSKPRVDADSRIVLQPRLGPSATPTPKPTKTPKPHPISVQALINKKYDGRDLKVRRLLADYGAYKRYIITYRGDGLTISGVMNVPDGKGPFPVLVLNHGYIDPDTLFSWPGHAPGTRLSGAARLRRAAHRLSRSCVVRQ